MEAGVYTDLTNLEYHAQTDWVSSTMLKRLIPEQYGPEPKSRANLDFGCALHTRVLGGPSEPITYLDYPTWQSKAAKDEQAAAYLRGEIPILLKDRALIEAMYTAVGSHSEASDLLLHGDGQQEVSVFTEADSVPLKARFDRIVGTTAVDLKTTSAKPSVYELTRAVVTWGYDLSASHYLRVAAAAGIELEKFTLVFVGKEPPHYVTVCELDDAFLERGEALRDLGLSRWLHPQFVDSYPGETGRVNLSLPRWAAID